MGGENQHVPRQGAPPTSYIHGHGRPNNGLKAGKRWIHRPLHGLRTSSQQSRHRDCAQHALLAYQIAFHGFQNRPAQILALGIFTDTAAAWIRLQSIYASAALVFQGSLHIDRRHHLSRSGSRHDTLKQSRRLTKQSGPQSSVQTCESASGAADKHAVGARE